MICNIYHNINSLEEIPEMQSYFIKVSDIIPLVEDIHLKLVLDYGIYLLHTEETRRYFATEILVVLTPLNSDEVGGIYIFTKTNEENKNNDNTLREWYNNNLMTDNEELQDNFYHLLSECEEVNNDNDIY